MMIWEEGTWRREIRVRNMEEMGTFLRTSGGFEFRAIVASMKMVPEFLIEDSDTVLRQF